MKTRVDLFGAGAKLALQKLLPALYQLYERHDISGDSIILAADSLDLATEDYRRLAQESISACVDISSHLKEFLELIRYEKIDYQNPSLILQDTGYASHLAYLCCLPEYDDAIADILAGMDDADEIRILIEKPYGSDLEHASMLHRRLADRFKEEHIYCVDQYLGAEPLQSILALRRNNPMIENLWDREHIEHIQISVLDTKGVGSRAEYYDRTGCIINDIQSHVLPILSALAVEDPFGGNIEEQRIAVLNSLHQIHETKIKNVAVFGQYAGYRTKEGIRPDSDTETFAALRLTLDQGRLKDVPLLLRAGMKCRSREIEASVTFRAVNGGRPDTLVLRFQPSEEVWLEINVKKPGTSGLTDTARIKYCVSSNDHMRMNTVEAYEEYLYTCMNGGHDGFTPWAEIELAWRYMNFIRTYYRSAHLPVYPYEPGTFGPDQVKILGEGWRNLE